jgi:hypothetical protein
MRRTSLTPPLLRPIRESSKMRSPLLGGGVLGLGGNLVVYERSTTKTQSAQRTHREKKTIGLGLPGVYEIIPQSRRAHRGRTDGDDYYPGSNCLVFSWQNGYKEDCASL